MSDPLEAARRAFDADPDRRDPILETLWAELASGDTPPAALRDLATRLYDHAPSDPDGRACLAAVLAGCAALADDAGAYAALKALAVEHPEDDDVARQLACAHFNAFQRDAWAGEDEPRPSAPDRFTRALEARDALAALSRRRALPEIQTHFAELLRLAIENRAEAEASARIASDLDALLQPGRASSGGLDAALDPLTYLAELEAHARAHDVEDIRWTLQDAVAGLVFQWSETRQSARRDAFLARLRGAHAAAPADLVALELLAVALGASAREAQESPVPGAAEAARAAEDELRALHEATTSPFVATQLAELLSETPEDPGVLDELRALVERHPGQEKLRSLLAFAADEYDGDEDED